MAMKLKITLVRSGINRPEPHKLTAAKLGLGKLGRTVVLPDNPSVRGMIRTISHMVKVESAE
ncbi:MAG TPA: 50S ribosomal protein L30 [Polyangia bacterium]